MAASCKLAQGDREDRSQWLESDLKGMTAQIVAAYVEANRIASADLPALISDIYRSLSAARLTREAIPSSTPKATPAQIRKSVTPDALISFEDGRSYKSLKRHLARYGLTPDQYRTKWGLGPYYPMVSPNYAAARSALAKAIGLGRNKEAPPLTTAKVIKPPASGAVHLP